MSPIPIAAHQVEGARTELAEAYISGNCAGSQHTACPGALQAAWLYELLHVPKGLGHKPLYGHSH